MQQEIETAVLHLMFAESATWGTRHDAANWMTESMFGWWMVVEFKPRNAAKPGSRLAGCFYLKATVGTSTPSRSTLRQLPYPRGLEATA